MIYYWGGEIPGGEEIWAKVKGDLKNKKLIPFCFKHRLLTFAKAGSKNLKKRKRKNAYKKK